MSDAEHMRNQFDGLGFLDAYKVKFKGVTTETHWMNVSLGKYMEIQTAMTAEDALPQWVNGFRVMAITRIPPRGGEVPIQFVVICDRGSDDEIRDPENRYVLWDVALKNGEYRCGYGFYDLSWAEAIHAYTDRVKRECSRSDWLD